VIPALIWQLVDLCYTPHVTRVVLLCPLINLITTLQGQMEVLLLNLTSLVQLYLKSHLLHRGVGGQQAQIDTYRYMFHTFTHVS